MEYVHNIPDDVFAAAGKKKDSILEDEDIIDNLWICYQKDVEDYGCDESFSLMDSVNEVLRITYDPMAADTDGKSKKETDVY